ncbi:hypothetical protein JCM15519_18650 [Fundidesulfovibrio butyratiphilus]
MEDWGKDPFVNKRVLPPNPHPPKNFQVGGGKEAGDRDHRSTDANFASGLIIFLRLASKFFEQAARIDCFNGLLKRKFFGEGGGQGGGSPFFSKKGLPPLSSILSFSLLYLFLYTLSAWTPGGEGLANENVRWFCDL